MSGTPVTSTSTEATAGSSNGLSVTCSAELVYVPVTASGATVTSYDRVTGSTSGAT